MPAKGFSTGREPIRRTSPMTFTSSKQRHRLLIAGVILTLLLAAVFTLGSLDTPFEPRNWRDVLTLYAVSSFITAALMVFALIVSRTVLRLWAERSREQLGARFKTKMVVGAVAISLLPVLFMFFVSYSLLNRTLARWFPRPIEIASEQSLALLNELGTQEHDRLSHLAAEWVAWDAQDPTSPSNTLASRCTAADAFWQIDATGKPSAFFDCRDETPAKLGADLSLSLNLTPSRVEPLPSGAEVWQSGGKFLLAGSARSQNGKTYY